jgi:hypothetical protein
MELTVGRLKELLNLEGAQDDWVLHFEGLDFYRLKRRGDKIVQVEFNQLVSPHSSSVDTHGKKR